MFFRKDRGDGYWSLVIGHWLLVIGHWLLVIGHWGDFGSLPLGVGLRKTDTKSGW